MNPIQEQINKVQKPRSGLYSIYLIVLLLLVGVSGCTNGSANQQIYEIEYPPQEVVDFVLSFECFEKQDCRAFAMADTHKMQLTATDLANNVEEKWCLGYTFIRKGETLNPGDEWYDAESSVVIRKKNQVWDYDREWTLKIPVGPPTSSCNYARK